MLIKVDRWYFLKKLKDNLWYFLTFLKVRDIFLKILKVDSILLNFSLHLLLS